jgi:hypothetical protein
VAGTTPWDYYYNEEWQLLELRMNGGSHPAEQFVWHPYYIDALAVQYLDADRDGNLAENNDGAHCYLQDANYNVTAVVDDNCNLLERYNYTPYGEVTFLNADHSIASSQYTSTIGNEPSQLYSERIIGMDKVILTPE